MEQSDMKRLAEFLFQQRTLLAYRENRNVSQSDMAERVGIPQGTYNKYEMGKVPPSDRNKHKLAAYFGIEIYEICGGPIMMPDNKILREIAKVWGKIPVDVQMKHRDQILDSVAEWEDRKPNFSQAAVPE